MNSYNPDLKYRCDIIRGKALKEMDDLLSLYADITHSLAPMTARDFNNRFDEQLAQRMDASMKTVRNQRSEMGRLFALYYEEDGIVYESEACKFLSESHDQPAFFKNMCLNFQFPNGTQKKETVTERIKAGMHFKPYHFILSLMSLAGKAELTLEKREVEYYALTAKEVLMGMVTPEVVFSRIVSDRKKGVVKELSATSFTSEPKEHSYLHQHSTELCNYLELANLIYQDGGYLHLNEKEQRLIDIFVSEINSVQELEGLDAEGCATELTRNLWAKYYGSLWHGQEIIATSKESIIRDDEENDSREAAPAQPSDSNKIGIMGELYVLKKEKERVRALRPIWENRVKRLGDVKGLGYDILSVDANENLTEAMSRLIEVKTTARVTLPKFGDNWYETVKITAKEWEAARQYGEHYYIYRVYITPKGFYVFVISNPARQHQEGRLLVYPIDYQLDITKKNLEQIYHE